MTVRTCTEHRGPLEACEEIHEARYQSIMGGRDAWWDDPSWDDPGVSDGRGHVFSDADPGL